MKNLAKCFWQKGSFKLLLFPGLWLTVLSWLILSNANEFIAIAIGVSIGVVSCLIYFFINVPVSWSALTIACRGILLCAVAYLSITVVDVGDRMRFNPIGRMDDLGWGWFPCQVEDIASVSNHYGKVVAVRRSFCEAGLTAGSGYLTYFVFVHDKNDVNASNNLAFRYEPDPYEKAITGPGISWENKFALRVSAIIPNGFISKKLGVVDGVKIAYALKN